MNSASKYCFPMETRYTALEEVQGWGTCASADDWIVTAENMSAVEKD
jgi:hypothetical protein